MTKEEEEEEKVQNQNERTKKEGGRNTKRDKYIRAQIMLKTGNRKTQREQRQPKEISNTNKPSVISNQLLCGIILSDKQT